MKLILESWRKFLKETQAEDIAKMFRGIGAGVHVGAKKAFKDMLLRGEIKDFAEKPQSYLDDPSIAIAWHRNKYYVVGLRDDSGELFLLPKEKQQMYQRNLVGDIHKDFIVAQGNGDMA